MPVGASLLAKNSQALRSFSKHASSLRVFASKLAPTGIWACSLPHLVFIGSRHQSRASASIGSRRAAFLAGTNPNTMPISVEQANAVMIEPTENTISHSFTNSENR